MPQYYSKTKKELVNINDMHHQHVWYAFKKLCDRLEQLALTQAIWDDAFNPAEDIKVNENAYVRKDVYELLFDKATRQDRTIEHYLNENSKLKKNANSRMVLKLEQEVSRLKKENSKLKSQDIYNSNLRSVFKLQQKISELKEQNEEYKKHCNNSVSIDVYENQQKKLNE